MLRHEGLEKRTRRPQSNGPSAGGFWRWACQAPPRAKGGFCATRARRRRCCATRALRRGPEGHRATARAQGVFGGGLSRRHKRPLKAAAVLQEAFDRQSPARHQETQGRQERTIWTAGGHQGGTREAGKNHWDSRGGTREAGKDHLGSLRGTREAGKDSLDSLRGTREAGKDPLDSLRGTREAPGRHQGGTRESRTAWEAPGRHQGGRKGSIGQLARHQGGRKKPLGQPGRHQGGRKEPFGQPARHQGGRKPLKEEPVLRGPKRNGPSAPS